MGIVDVLEGDHPVAGHHLAGPPDVVVGLEELGRQVLVRVHRLALAHPDEDEAFYGDSWEGPGMELAGHLRLRPFREHGDALAVAIEGRAVVRAGDVALV